MAAGIQLFHRDGREADEIEAEAGIDRIGEHFEPFGKKFVRNCL